MLQTNLAAIDLGTNSCRLLIANSTGDIIYRKSTNTKLGEGLHAAGRFTDEAVKRGMDCLREYSDLMQQHQVAKYRAVATAACRMAKNGAEFVNEVKENCGICLEIVDAKEEALLNLKGAQLNADENAEYILVYDLGGGSTEITLATNSENPHIIYTISVPWGATSASEAHDLTEYNAERAELLKKEIQRYTREFLQGSDFEKYRGKCDFLATSSTVLRLVSMIRQTGTYNRLTADKMREGTDKFDEQIRKIQTMNREQMADCPYIGENRAPIFQAACIIFQTIYNDLKIPQLTASLKGAQEAIINELVNK